jgi:predicted RNA-binding protein
MSTAYERKGEDDLLVCENVREARAEGGEVVLVDILGFSTKVPGVIKRVDFVKSKIMIEAI